MLCPGQAYEKFTSSVLTIQITHVQEPGRKNVDTSISNTRVVHGSGQESGKKRGYELKLIQIRPYEHML